MCPALLKEARYKIKAEMRWCTELLRLQPDGFQSGWHPRVPHGPTSASVLSGIVGSVGGAVFR